MKMNETGLLVFDKSFAKCKTFFSRMIKFPFDRYGEQPRNFNITQIIPEKNRKS